jgi:hypothetical protein
MRVLVVVLVTGVVLAAGSYAFAAPPSSTPKESIVSLDAVAIDPVVDYSKGGFWCSFNDYGAVFGNYTGQCPAQEYVAVVHWKKVPGVAEYDICVKPVFRDYSPGFACYVVDPPKAGNPASLTMTFDSATMFLNSFQGTTQVFVVRACTVDPVSQASVCSQSNEVSFEIPWTG